MSVPMPPGVNLSRILPDWVKISLADAVVAFGRIEQEIIEISSILNNAELKEKLKIAGKRATDNFIEVINIAENQQEGLDFSAIKDGFRYLAKERNLVVHGSWAMANEKPYVVWHKFLEDDDSVVGEYFEQWRFEKFMKISVYLLKMLGSFHDMLEDRLNIKTTALPRF